jgi:predicted DNA-binding protein YlxM (UPF0122 family)
MRYTIIPILLFLFACNIKETKQISGYLNLERQYYSQQHPDSLTGSFTRKLYFNNNYSFLTVADSSATADDHLYIRDYTTNTVYLKKTFDSVNYYAEFPIKKNENITYTSNKKVIHGYECREGIHIGHMKDTTTFWSTDKIGLDRTIWSLVDVDGFVLETKYQNGIKKVIKDINFQEVQDSFFTEEIAKIKTYKKESYYGLKIVEAKWELDYFKNRLEIYRKRKNDKEITSEIFESIENDFKSLFKDIESRIEELKENEKKT